MNPESTSTQNEDRPLLLNAEQAAEFCGGSLRTWRAWDAAGRVPAAMKIGRSKYWRTSELKAWVEQGCPRRKIWNAMTDGEMA